MPAEEDSNIDLLISFNEKLWYNYSKKNNWYKEILVILKKTLEHLQYEKSSCEVSILLTNDQEIQELNKIHRNKDKPTNVLSFPMNLDYKYDIFAKDVLGDMVFSFDTIEKEAKEQNKPFMNHFTHLLVHGALHLLGYDHVDDEQAELMEKLEVEILEKLQLTNPYTNNVI
jgi:probable rRNA maturation factor